MSQLDTTALENTSRSVMGWEGYDGRTHFRPVIVAAASAMAIILSAASVLFAVI